MLNRSVVVVVAAICGLSLPTGAWACSCMPYPADPQLAVEQAWKQADTIVRAKVRSKRLIPDRRHRDAVEVVLDVKQRWKGANLGKLRVRTPRTSAACGYNFDRKWEYLVFVSRNPATNEYSASLCSLTRPVRERGARELMSALDKVAETENTARREAQK